jgi:hypothetical protein
MLLVQSDHGAAGDQLLLRVCKAAGLPRRRSEKFLIECLLRGTSETVAGGNRWGSSLSAAVG